MRVSVIEVAARIVFKERFEGTPVQVDEDVEFFMKTLRDVDAAAERTDREAQKMAYNRQYMKRKREASRTAHN